MGSPLGAHHLLVALSTISVLSTVEISMRSPFHFSSKCVQSWSSLGVTPIGVRLLVLPGGLASSELLRMSRDSVSGMLRY